MKLVTYNMRKGGSRDHWQQMLESFEPDVILAQETKNPALFAGDLFHPLPVESTLWRPVNRGPWGSAIWAGSRMSVAEIPVPGFDGWVVGGAVEGLAEPMHVFSVHMPSGRGPYVRLANRLMDELDPIVNGAPFLLGGDWNFTVASLVSEDSMEYRAGEREFLARMAEQFEAEPVWRLANPTGPLPQTLRWTGDPSTVFHCDGVFVSGELRRAVRSAVVPSDPEWESMSDHSPLLVDFE